MERKVGWASKMVKDGLHLVPYPLVALAGNEGLIELWKFAEGTQIFVSDVNFDGAFSNYVLNDFDDLIHVWDLFLLFQKLEDPVEQLTLLNREVHYWMEVVVAEGLLHLAFLEHQAKSGNWARVYFLNYADDKFLDIGHLLFVVPLSDKLPQVAWSCPQVAGKFPLVGLTEGGVSLAHDAIDDVENGFYTPLAEIHSVDQFVDTVTVLWVISCQVFQIGKISYYGFSFVSWDVVQFQLLQAELTYVLILGLS